MQGEAALLVDDVVPHAQAALLGLSEVVGVEDARRVVVQVDRDQAVIRVAQRLEAGRVDHRHLRVGPVCALEVQLLLHACDVGVPLLHDEPGGGAHLQVVADVAVDHDHVVLGHVGVLDLGDRLVVLPRHRLAAGLAVHDIRRGRGAGEHLGLHVHVAELGDPSLRHLFGERAQFVCSGIVEDLCHGGASSGR